jgi:hypothetical protein
MSKWLTSALCAALSLGVSCSSDDDEVSPVPGRAERSSAARVEASDEGSMELVTPSEAGRAAAQAPRAREVATAMDAGARDAAMQVFVDAAPSEEDAGEAPLPECLPFELPNDCPEMTGPASPVSLRCAGLYADMQRGILACGLTEYAPAYELWSDAAVKRRWVSLPSAARVDTSDPDALVFPVGTRLWKEFQVLLDGELHRAETRLLRKVERGWVFTTYVWSRDGQSAMATNDGVRNWEGSGHTVPTRDQCVECHGGRRDLVLGWDPVLLGPGARGVHFEDLLAADDDAGVPSFVSAPPGDDVERAALGYLHVNCGVSCHNDSIDARARDTALYLRLATGRDDSVHETPAVVTAINKLPTGNAPFFELPAPPDGPFYDLHPRSPARSLVLARMLVRDHPAQMPPLASNVVDEVGAGAVRAWIEGMTTERGYALPAP